MSGGRFDYAQYRIADIYTKIEDYVDVIHWMRKTKDAFSKTDG